MFNAVEESCLAVAFFSLTCHFSFVAPTYYQSIGRGGHNTGDLVFKGPAQPSGYTEPLLHAWRLKVKAG